ncbi:hypothetical protein ACIGZJ_36130 [Kitasatospora sp. NPDC052868]
MSRRRVEPFRGDQLALFGADDVEQPEPVDPAEPSVRPPDVPPAPPDSEA